MDNQPDLAPAPVKTNGFVAFLQAKRSWPTWVIIVALCVVFGLGHATAGSNDTTTVTTANTSTTVAAHGTTGKTTTTSPTATPAPKTTTIASYSGSSNKNTQNFHVNADQWTISWTCRGGQYGGNLMVDVYQSDGTYIDGAVNVICNGAMHDITLERGSGDYYLSVTADVSWTVTIQATQ